MAARATTLLTLTLVLMVGVMAWCVGAGMVWVRYNAQPRPQPRPYDTFPYGVLRVGIDPSNPPFAFYTNNEMVGLDVELGRALARHIGIEVRFVPLGFDGLYDALFTDSIDVLMSVNVDASRFDKVSYGAPYFDNGWVLVSTPMLALENWRDLPTHTLALEFGSEADGMSRAWSRRIAAFTVLPYERPDDALDAVRYDVADAALVENLTLAQYNRSHTDFEHVVSLQTHVPLAFAVRSDHTAMAQRLNEILRQMQQSGELQAILARWL
jgi:ABC-type amino acid transport substrate-binding protein